jgi:hypothetical protein
VRLAVLAPAADLRECVAASETARRQHALSGTEAGREDTLVERVRGGYECECGRECVQAGGKIVVEGGRAAGVSVNVATSVPRQAGRRGGGKGARRV